MLSNTGVWPSGGEIDIMEQVGSDPTTIFGTLFMDQGPSGQSKTTQVADACTAMHDYQLTWTADRMLIGVDNVNYYSYVNPKTGHAAWPFDSPQYLLMNIAIGGRLGGAIDDAIFPVTLEVDYVKVYQPTK